MTLDTQITKKRDFAIQLRQQADRCSNNTERLQVLASYYIENIYYDYSSLALGAMIDGFMTTDHDVDWFVNTTLEIWMESAWDNWETVIALTNAYSKEWLDDDNNIITMLLGRFAVLNAGK